MSQTGFEWITSGRRLSFSLGTVAIVACCAWAVSALSSTPLVGGPTVYARGVTIHDPMKAHQGFNLFIDPSRNPSQGQIVLLDMDGVEVQTWSSPLTGSDQAMHVEALPGGNVLAIFNRPMTGSYDLVEMDWNGSIVWQYQAPAGTTLHHDFERLPNGNTLVLASEEIIDPEVGPNTLADDVVQEIDVSGQVVWSWSTADHYDQMPFSDTERVFIWFANGQGKKFVFHTNAVSTLPPNVHETTDPRFTAGNLLISQRDTSTVFLVDRATGDVVWSFRQAMGQHMPYMIDLSMPGAGNILMLDNGGDAGYPTDHRLWSQVLEVDPVNWTSAWIYDATSSSLRHPETFLSVRKGSAQRLPNGNTLITEATWGRVFEVTTSGEIVWEYVLPADRDIYRCERVDPAWPVPSPRPRFRDDRRR